jgi:4-hydroxythreonine-4-phosphate dehydrogenase
VANPLLVTMGDPAGIGPEIIARAFREAPADMAGCAVVGDVATLRRAAALVALPLALPVAQLDSLADLPGVPPNCIAVLQQCTLPGLVPYGQVSAVAGQAAADCIVWAARRVLAGEAAALVTAPIHKEALSAAGGWAAGFPGHTEMLQAEAAAFLGKPVGEVPVRMMLANDELRTVLVSIHMSLRHAIEAVTSTTCCKPCASRITPWRPAWGAPRASRWRGSIPMRVKAGCSAVKSRPSSPRPLPRPGRKAWM